MKQEQKARPHPGPLPQERGNVRQPVGDTAREVTARLARVRHELVLLGVLQRVSGIRAPVEEARLLRKLERVKKELSVAVRAELAAIQRDYGLASENPVVRKEAVVNGQGQMADGK